MKTCPNCNAQLDDSENQKYCTSCGHCFEQPANDAEKETGSNQTTTDTPQPTTNIPQPQTQYGPALKLATNRGLLKMILLSLITFDIYGAICRCRMADEINIVASRYDGKKTMPLLGMVFVAIFSGALTFGIVAAIISLCWNHRFSNRVGNEARRRGYFTGFGAKTFWLWYILGSLIVIGPFVYIHKLCKTMNKINKSYNYYG